MVAKEREGILERIRKEAPAYKGREVFLCFSCDPYQMIDDKLGLTRETIRILHDNDIIVRILTKGGRRSTRDFDLLSARPELSIYGATLTFINSADSAKYEPMAAPPNERFAALMIAHGLGIRTWASLEPVIDPMQTLEIIKQTHKFVDEFKVGKWNYGTEATRIDWKAFGHEAVELLRGYGKEFYIKKELQKHMDISHDRT